MSSAVLEELSEFFLRDVSRPSSCRSIIVDGQETPVRYWKDSIKNLVNQYLLEFPNGVKRTYIYSHLPPSFRSDTMLAELELGVRLREIQRDWYGKRGISLHGLLAIAQVDENKKVSEVLDLWSEDTKQDSWFTQSAMDVGFTWLQKAFPGFRVYLFSGTS